MPAPSGLSLITIKALQVPRRFHGADWPHLSSETTAMLAREITKYLTKVADRTIADKSAAPNFA